MVINSGLLAGRSGWVLGVESRLARGHVFAADLVRAQLRAAGRVALRRRLSRAFADYLVTDYEAEPVAVWSSRREWHQFGFNAYAGTSCRWPLGLRGDFQHASAGRGVVAGGPIDAPEELAAGSVISCLGEPHARLVLRGEDYAAVCGRLDRQGVAI